MFKIKTISRFVLIVMLMLFILISVNGQDVAGTKVEINDEGKPEIVEPKPEPILEPKVTNLDVFLIDKINNNSVNLKNCVLVLAGELMICEDKFNYKNSFDSGDIYTITILIEPKNK